MELRTDFARREVVLPGGEAWRPSPMAGAERYMLDRIGEEVARETSIVRYAAGARFSAHTHAQVSDFFLELRQLAESRLAEVRQVTRQYLEQRGALEPVDNEELVRRVRAGEVTVIDVRPREEYVAGHIPGAISVPLADLPKRLRDLRKRHDIVAYCRGLYCVMSLDAVDLLRQKGVRAQRLEHGVVEWRAQGWRVDTGEHRNAG